LDLSALGDFPTSNRTSESLSLGASDVQLGIPANTLALTASAQANDSNQSFIGYSERLGDRLDFLLWPQGSACQLFERSSGDSFPGVLGGEALGFAPTSGLVMVAGSNDATSAAIVGALTFDTRTGESHVVDPRLRAVLSEPRAFASVSDFGDQVLVAGGENPIHDASVEASVLRDSAELYDPTSRSFQADLLMLAVPRSHHAAANLDSGEVVLVGGRAEGSDASTFVEVISPSTRVSKLVENLSVARRDAQALHLSDGRILVAGGLDAAGHPVGALEWRGADASQLGAPWDGTTSIPARFGRSFVALAGGAALAVGGCADRDPEPNEDCSTWCPTGCPPTSDPVTKQRYDAFWLAPDGAVSALDFPFSAAQPILLPGSDSRPWLISEGVDDSGQPAPGAYVAYRFDPWAQTFVPADLDLGVSDATDAPRFVATGADAFVWFGEDGSTPALRGLRLGTRSAYTNDVDLVTLRDSDDATRPAHLAPDQPPGTSVQYDSVHGILHFENVEESARSSRVCVWISDADYADFSAEVAFSSQATPTIQLGTQALADPRDSEVDSTCALPLNVAGPGVLELDRRDGNVRLIIGGAQSTCNLGAGRLPLGVCGSSLGPVQVTRISVTRGG
jgi:hypothetical protein